MSHSSYKHKPFRVYYVGWSYESKGKRIRFLRPSYAQTEEEALKDTEDNISMSKYESFHMRVIGFKDY